MARSFRIGSRIIDDSSRPYLIAELGHNHRGSLETCVALFRAAKEAGADAVKLQKRSNRDLYTKAAYNLPYGGPNSYGATYGEHREFLEFGRPQYLYLQGIAQALELDFFATAFDPESADFLAELGMPAIKVASGDITNTPFLRFLARLGVPLIVSTGTASQNDVDVAVEALEGSEFALLQCTAEYPAVPERLNLRVIETYRERYPDTVIGLSSHLPEIYDASWGTVLGARIVEKHFTLDRGWKGSDHAMSLTPDDFLDMRREVDGARVAAGLGFGFEHPAFGDGVKRRYPQEAGAISKMGKVLFSARPLPAGHILTVTDIITRSPGGVGLTPQYQLVGLTLQVPMAEEEPFAAEKVALA